MNLIHRDFTPIAANTPGEARLHNRRIILQALRRYGGLSRAELARMTGLTPQAIANIISALMEDRMVKETGRKKLGRGQPSITIELESDGGFAVGLRIDSTSYNLVAVSLAGETLSKDQGAVVDNGPGVLNQIEALHRQVMRRHKGLRCFGLGMVTPGPFDTSWPGVPSPGSVEVLQRHSVSSELSSRLGVEVFQANDAYAAAIGERLYGAARNLNDFFYLYIGEGVGGGIVIGGESYRGAGGNGGEVGHLIVDPNGRKCYCGNRGCLGQYLSLAALRDESREAWLCSAIPALRTAVSSIENLFDPQAIILGGTADTPLLADLTWHLGQPGPSVRQDHKQRILLSTLGEESPALGASALPLLTAGSLS